jgi:hypothetical protein
MPVKEASATDTPTAATSRRRAGSCSTSRMRWPFGTDEKGGAIYPLESREHRFGDFGVNVHVLWPGEPKETYELDEAYADWPGEYEPVRLPPPLDG